VKGVLGERLESEMLVEGLGSVVLCVHEDSPDVAAVDGRLPNGATASNLLEVPISWPEQLERASAELVR
jgi:hypothetical protein